MLGAGSVFPWMSHLISDGMNCSNRPGMKKCKSRTIKARQFMEVL